MKLSINLKEIEELLPMNIQESDILTKNDKTVLAVILKAYSVMSESARSNGYVFLTNDALARSCKLSKSSILESVRRLKVYDLVTKEIGSPRTDGNKGIANRYIVNFGNLKKPIVQKTFDSLFADFLDKQVPTVEETPLAACDVVIPTFEEKQQSKGIEELECSIGEFSDKEKDYNERFNEAARYLRLKNSNLCKQGKSPEDRRNILKSDVMNKYAHGDGCLGFFQIEELYEMIEEISL